MAKQSSLEKKKYILEYFFELNLFEFTRHNPYTRDKPRCEVNGLLVNCLVNKKNIHDYRTNSSCQSELLSYFPTKTTCGKKERKETSKFAEMSETDGIKVVPKFTSLLRARA